MYGYIAVIHCLFCFLESDIVEESNALGIVKNDVFIPLTIFSFTFTTKLIPPTNMEGVNGFMV